MFLGCLWSGDMELYFYDDQIVFVGCYCLCVVAGRLSSALIWDFKRNISYLDQNNYVSVRDGLDVCCVP